MTNTIRAGVACFIGRVYKCGLGFFAAFSMCVVLTPEGSWGQEQPFNNSGTVPTQEPSGATDQSPPTAGSAAAIPPPDKAVPETNGNPAEMDRIVFSPAGLTSKSLSSFQNTMREYSKAAAACSEDKAGAANACEDSKSPILHSLKTNLANAVAGIGAVMGSKDPCSKFADAMKGAAALLPMFGQSCSSGIASCKSSCGTALSALRKLVKTNGSVVQQLQLKAQNLASSYEAGPDTEKVAKAVEIANKELLNDDKTPEENRAFCAVRAMSMMAQGIQQANGAMMGMGQGSECNKDTTGATAANDGLKGLGPDSSEAYCAAHPAEPQCNCSLSQNAGTKRCLCMTDMRNPYCNDGLASGRGDGSLQKLGVGSGGAIGAGGGGKSALNLDDGMAEDPKITLPPKGGDEPAARGGAGGGGMAGSGGSGNQMGGPGGGGGTPAISKTTNPGGWMAGGGSPSKLSNNDEEANKKRGPANKADQNKVAAAEFAKQVSPLGGRTNWEKVKIRYLDNARTLIQK